MDHQDIGLWRRILRAPKSVLTQGWRSLAPWQRGAYLGAITFGLILALAAGSQMPMGPVYILARLAGFIAALLALVGFLLGARIILALAPILLRIPWAIIGAAGVLWVVITFLMNAPDAGFLWGLGYLVISFGFGGALGHLIAGRWASSPLWSRSLVAAFILAGVAAMTYVAYWISNPGDDQHIEAVTEWEATGALAGVPDPSKAGDHEVLTLTYGSGTDKQRSEFGAGAAFTTPTVDGSKLAKFDKGWGKWLRESYWGFDLKEAPLNGRVWYPEGDGPWPLVLIVHGNHHMVEHSDPGYAYLGEHFASHGYITVSVDENFLNGYWASNASGENDCRAWLLLEHLKQWRAWQGDPEHAFFGKVDMDRIALIGHSRGGEAAATAAAFNRIEWYPDDATIEFDYNFNIRGVLAIAPSDGQYRPSYKRTPLNDVSYFTLSGGHDADVSSFTGTRQYNRTTISPDSEHFKASLWIQRANHGQFNQVWGNEDSSFPTSLALNKRALMSGEDQRQIAKVYFHAFLDTTLKERDTYIPLFRDPRAGADWLPAEQYVNRYSDASRETVCNFEEDIDLATGSVPGVTIEATGFGLRKEHYLDMRDWGSTLDTALYIGWRKAEDEDDVPPVLSVNLPDDWAGPEADAITFAMARVDESVPKPDDEEDGDESEEDEADADEVEAAQEDEAIDWKLTVGLTLSDGSSASVELEAIRPIPPILRSKFTKYADETHRYSDDWEATLQDYVIPLEAFGPEVAKAGASAVRRIEFRFEALAEGVVALDDIGFIGSGTP